jgi:hypothetical protein
MEAGPQWTGVLLVHDPWTKPTDFSIQKQIRKAIILGKFVKRPLDFFVIKQQPPNFQEEPWFSKIILDIPLPEITNRSSKFISPYLCNRNSDFGDFCAKILKITTSFILYIHLTHVCSNLLIDLFALC